MRGYADGKIFLLHTEEQVPIAAFLFSPEAHRIMEGLKKANIECYIKDIACFGIEVQTVYTLLYGKDTKDLLLGYTSLKDAKNMYRILSDTSPSGRISAVSCFKAMRNQTIGKYKLKYANGPVQHTNLVLDTPTINNAEGQNKAVTLLQ